MPRDVFSGQIGNGFIPCKINCSRGLVLTLTVEKDPNFGREN